MTNENLNVGTFKIVTMLSLIANIVWGILFSILLIACILNGQAIIDSTKDTISPDAFFGNIIVLFLILSVVVVLLCWFCISGIRKMKKGERSGFYSYAIANALWALLQINIGSDGTVPYIVSGLISIGFIFYFALKLPKLS